MATSSTIQKSYFSLFNADRHDGLGLTLSAALPLAVFVIANGLGEINGLTPLFFSPFMLPGWLGAVIYLAGLPLFGIARWMVAARGEQGRRAGWWLVALMAGMIVLPFLVTPVDSLLLTILSFGLLVLGLGTMVRVGKVDPKAALVMAPGMAWMGFSAFVGLSFSSAWSPPFAVTNSHGAA